MALYCDVCVWCGWSVLLDATAFVQICPSHSPSLSSTHVTCMLLGLIIWVLGGTPVLCHSCTTCPTSRSSLVHCCAATYVRMYIVVSHTIASCPPCIPIAQYHHKWMVHDTTWLDNWHAVNGGMSLCPYSWFSLKGGPTVVYLHCPGWDENCHLICCLLLACPVWEWTNWGLLDSGSRG